MASDYQLSISIEVSLLIEKQSLDMNDLFELERVAFSDRYASCPKTYSEYIRKYNEKRLIIIKLHKKDILIGARIFEIVDLNYAHSLYLAVYDEFRGQGYGYLISSSAVPIFKLYGIKRVSSWTHIDLDAVKYLAQYAPLISEESILNSEELFYIHLLEKYRNLPTGHYGDRRRVKDYYTMKNNPCNDAHFYVHKVD